MNSVLSSGALCRLTNKDSIERSAPKMIEYKQDVIARSLNAIRGWTSPGACLASLIVGKLRSLAWY